jgi:hypothetical protein
MSCGSTIIERVINNPQTPARSIGGLSPSGAAGNFSNMDIIVPDLNGIRITEQGEDYSDAKYERHPHGIVIVNGVEVATTLMCPHCGAHFISRKGSGTRRTFCLKCMAVTCGQPACDPCRPVVAEYGQLQGREF